MPEIELPPGTHYALTWCIPDQYAGMTASLLQRSRAFVKYAGVEVTVLTYDHRLDYDAIRKRLMANGAIVDGIRIANMWEDLRAMDNADLGRAQFTATPPAEVTPLGDRGTDTGQLTRELVDEDGTLRQTDYFRADGTLLVSDQYLAPDKRWVTLFDTAGKPLGSWDWATRLYHFWWDRLPREPKAWLIVDSKSSANMVPGYDSPDVVKMHVVRGTHLRRGHEGPLGELTSPRRFVMERLNHWDAVVFLTKKQRDAVDTRFGPLNNLHVIPNSREVPAELPTVQRPRGRGVMLASLEPRKQIGHAIRAMAMAKRRVWPRRIQLDVWGQGPSESRLRSLIKSTRAPVRLRGHSPQAAAEFGTANFSVLTSRSEAFGNVLIESMGRGCIPITYDIPYGPSDIITHGVDGFIVPFDDVDALASEIAKIVKTPPAQLEAIRLAGHRRAREFSDRTAVERWAKLMRDLDDH